MKHIISKPDLGKYSLQIAGTSLDAGAKVYSIRVDDIHLHGLQLANSMARADNKLKNKGFYSFIFNIFVIFKLSLSKI